MLGRPDFAFRGARVAVFVDGCFWHGCEDCGRSSKSNVEFWSKKVDRNKTRDKLNEVELSKMGIKVMRFWEHEVVKDLEKVNIKIFSELSRTI